MTCLLPHNHNIINSQHHTEGQHQMKVLLSRRRSKRYVTDIGTLIRTSPHVFAGVCSVMRLTKPLVLQQIVTKTSYWALLTQLNICKVGGKKLRWFRSSDGDRTGHNRTGNNGIGEVSEVTNSSKGEYHCTGSRTYGLCSVQLYHCDQSRWWRSPTDPLASVWPI